MKIVLCGFMGSGKSNIGRRLAKKLDCAFVDMDKYIEGREGMPVRDIFAAKGEEYFRALETKVIPEIAAEDPVVIASGGGTVINPKNVEAFHGEGAVICFLDVPVAALQERLKSDKKRPLLQRPDRREFIAKLHSERFPKYHGAADFVIAAGAPPVVVAERVLEAVKGKGSGSVAN